jgi:hypothetical protein
MDYCDLARLLYIMLSKKEFLSQPKYRTLSSKDKEARYKSYIQSQKSTTTRVSNSRPKQKVAMLPSDRCLADYAQLLANPFVESGHCLPIFPAKRSKKFSTYCRGVRVVVGVDGYGFAMIAPHEGVCYNGDPVQYTTAATAGSALTKLSVYTNLAQASCAGPHAASDFSGLSDDLRYRLVAAGARIRYVGTELAKNGTVAVSRHPDLDSFFSGNLDSADIMSFPNTRVHSVTRAWTVANWLPIDEINHQYDDSPISGQSSNYSLIFLIHADPGTSFDLEFYGHYEIIGLHARELSPSYSSPKGESFLDALNNAGASFGIQDVQAALAAVGAPAIQWAQRQIVTAGTAYVAERMRQLAGPRIQEIE